MKYSIVIPTYNHCYDLLKPCLDSLIQNSDLSTLEIIVVANGCTDDTQQIIEKYNLSNIKLLWFDEPLGYAKSTNAGIKASEGEYIILLNNDTIIQDQETNHWIERMVQPFLDDDKVAVTGPLKCNGNQSPTGKDFVIFFCAMVPKRLFDQLGLLDEQFIRGGAEDIDFCIRAELAGYKTVQISNHKPGMDFIDYPVMHYSNLTVKEIENWNSIFESNLVLLSKKYSYLNEKMKYSIIIPTYNHLEDCLKPCIESILKYTTFEETEIIVVGNGCTDGSFDYLLKVKEKLGNNLNIVWDPKPLGYTKATNLGIQNARGEYLILLNNDTNILDSPVNEWIKMLEHPFTVDNKVGITGPMRSYSPEVKDTFLIFFCVMLKKSLINELGLLDEIFNPGFGEDVDFSIKAVKAGYTLIQVPSEDNNYYAPERMIGGFPIYHEGEATFGETPNGMELLRKNRLILLKRYQDKEIKLNLGCGDKLLNDFINIDLYNENANYKMDSRILDFDNETVKEIYASHIFEHFSPYEVNNILKEWNRVLIPSGKLIMEMPDILEICKNFESSNKEKRYELLNVIYGTTMPTGVPPHLYGWYDEILYDHLINNGFENINIYPFKSDHWGYNLKVEATKNKSLDIPKGKIYDCFPFHNELDILEIRLNELYTTVDKFIIVEGTKDFANNYKPLFFQDNKERFAKFLDKIVHIIVYDWPEYTDSWVYERFQRDAIDRGLAKLNCNDNDIIIMSDLDEIPKAEIIQNYNINQGIINLEQILYYYNFHCKSDNIWNWSKILPYSLKKNMSPCYVRYFYAENKNAPSIPNAGWHFSFFGNVDQIIEKIEATAHQEYNKDEFKNKENIKECVKLGKDLYGRNLQYLFSEVDETYPKYVTDNIEYYTNKGLIYE
jgi:beta-1,4-mannosyl-glycoprotein beta-1,4-N-acetylglucosaminyltransferase